MARLCRTCPAGAAHPEMQQAADPGGQARSIEGVHLYLHAERCFMTRRENWFRAALLAFAAAAFLGAAGSACAEVNINVDHPNAQPLPIAIPDLRGTNPGETEAGHGVTQVVSADLQRSGLFRPLDP